MTFHPEAERLSRLIPRCLDRATVWSGTTFRSVTPKYAKSKDLVSGEGACRFGGRWNPPGSFPTVYLSLDMETAFAEFRAQWHRYGMTPEAALPRVFCAIEVDLRRLLDLCDGRTRQRLCVSRKRMTQERWLEKQEAGEEALAQAIGRIAFESNAEGLLVPSAAHPRGRNLIVFPDRLYKESRIRAAGLQG